jgi:hypothetical protein
MQPFLYWNFLVYKSWWDAQIFKFFCPPLTRLFFLFFWQARFLYSYARLSSSQSILRDPIISYEAEEPVLTPTWLILISECKYTLHNSMCCLGLKGNWILNPKPTRPLLSIEHFIGALFLLIHYISSVSNSTELKIENMYDMKTWNLFTST